MYWKVVECIRISARVSPFDEVSLNVVQRSIAYSFFVSLLGQAFFEVKPS